jgi:hypothetical protein
VEASTNLLTGTWTSIDTRTMPTNGVAQIVDTNAVSVSARFYRATVNGIRSDNAVGYCRRTIPAGYKIVGYPFVAKDNRIAAVLANAPDGTLAYKWDERIQNYVINTNNVSTGWTDDQMTLRPGEAAMLYAPSSFQWASFGEILQNCVNSTVATNFVLISSPIPLAGQVDTALQFPVSKQDLYETRNSDGSWNGYSFTSGGWTPGTPAVAELGDGFFSKKSRETIWVQNFSIW